MTSIRRQRPSWTINALGVVALLFAAGARIALPRAAQAAPLGAAQTATNGASVTTGQVYAWGYNSYSQPGGGATTSSPAPTAMTLPNGAHFIPTAIAAGASHNLAIGLGGQPYAWGANEYGQLGDGTTTTNSPTPRPITLPNGAPFTVSAIAAGPDYSLAVGPDSQLYAWGDNEYGQLGDGTTTTRPTPTLVTLVDYIPFTVSAIAAGGGDGGSHSLAISSSGQLYAWGANTYGQLGDGTTTNSPAPEPIMLSNGVPFSVSAIAAGAHHSLAIGPGGQLYAWGDNEYGQLGDGTTTTRLTPEPINLPGGAPFRPSAIAAGGFQSLAIAPTVSPTPRTPSSPANGTTTQGASGWSQGPPLRPVAPPPSSSPAPSLLGAAAARPSAPVASPTIQTPPATATASQAPAKRQPTVKPSNPPRHPKAPPSHPASSPRIVPQPAPRPRRLAKIQPGPSKKPESGANQPVPPLPPSHPAPALRKSAAPQSPPPPPAPRAGHGKP